MNRNGKILLNSKWDFIKDTDMKLSCEEIFNKISAGNFDGKMNIPSNWEIEGLHNFNGTVWFIKEFEFAADKKNDVKILKFFGVDYFADVWLNKTYLGSHEGYFQPFHFQLQNLLTKKNSLIVKVTSPFEEPKTVWPLKKKLIKGIFNHHDCRPGGWSFERGQEQNTGGIWNDVVIYSGQKIFIKNVKISSNLTEGNKSANVSLEVNYISALSSAEKKQVKINLISPSKKSSDLSDEIIFYPGQNKFSKTFRIKNPQLWWSWDLGKANLYSLKLSSSFFNEEEIQFGIKEVFLDEEKQFFINGRKLFLRGTNIIPAQFLSGLSPDRIKKIVRLIKEANINIVRVHAHVNKKELYDEFDKEGILIWQDFSLQWTYDTSTEFMNNAVSQISDMVRILYNHPSISFWCCHNEPGEQIHSLDVLLHQAVLKEDTSRIIRTASNYEEHPYDGWYWGNKDHYAAAPMGPLVTEFGAQALPEVDSLKKFIRKDALFPPNWKEWEYHNFQPDQTFNIAEVEMGKDINSFVENSQIYQADILKTAVDFYRRKKFKGITGVFQFMFIDCWPSITWSVVDFYLKKKKGYEVLKDVFQPLYISANLRQSSYYRGKKFNLELYLINDLYESFFECSLNIKLNDKNFYKIKNINLPPNGLIHYPAESFNLVVPYELKKGMHSMTFELINKNSKALTSSRCLFNIAELKGYNEKIS